MATAVAGEFYREVEGFWSKSFIGGCFWGCVSCFVSDWVSCGL